MAPSTIDYAPSGNTMSTADDDAKFEAIMAASFASELALA